MRLLILFLFSSLSYADSFNRMALTAGGATREQQAAFDASRFWKLGESTFYFGSGVRVTSQWSQGQNFRTAPAVLTRGQSGLGAMIRPEKKNNIDDLIIGNSQLTSINVVAQILYKWNEDWSIGANIDLVGATFGRLRKGKYNPKSEDQDWPEVVSARPTPFNLLLGDDNDKGSINSELYVHRHFKNGWGLKLGVVHAFSEYTTTSKLRKNNDRFRKKNYLPTLGITRLF